MSKAPAPAPKTAKRPPNDRGQGRKTIPDEERAVNMSIRLKPAHRNMYNELGGLDWLRPALEAAYKRIKKAE